MLVELTEDGSLKVTEAKFSLNQGILQCSGEMLTGGSKPTFAFEGKFTALPLSAFLPQGILALVNGTISGEFSASGSTNDSDGICYHITGRPNGSDGIILTKELVLLRMLSHLDPLRSYRKVTFNEGSFKLETKGNVLTFSEVDLSSQDADTSQQVSQLRGDFVARPTTKEEIEREVYTLDSSTSNSSDTSETIGATEPDEMSLEEQAVFANSIITQHKTVQFLNPPRELYFFTKDSAGKDLIKQRLDLTPRRTFRFPYVVEGQLDFAVPTSAFQNTPSLPGVSPHEDNPDLQWLQINLNNMIQASTKQLSNQWEEALNEAAENN